MKRLFVSWCALAAATIVALATPAMSQVILNRFQGSGFEFARGDFIGNITTASPHVSIIAPSAQGGAGAGGAFNLSAYLASGQVQIEARVVAGNAATSFDVILASTAGTNFSLYRFSTAGLNASTFTTLTANLNAPTSLAGTMNWHSITQYQIQGGTAAAGDFRLEFRNLQVVPVPATLARLHLHTFDLVPEALKAPGPVVTYGDNNNWAPNSLNKRITYQGLELTGDATTNGSITLAYAAPLDLRRFSRLELNASALGGNTLDPLTIELASTELGVTRRSVFFAGTDWLDRFGGKVDFRLNPAEAWHRDGTPVNLERVDSVTLGGIWSPAPTPARVILRDLHAVNDTLLDPAFFPAAHIATSGSWRDYGVVTQPDGSLHYATAPGALASYTYGLYFRFVHRHPLVLDERDLTPFQSIRVAATPLAGNAADLRIELRSTDGGASFWTLVRSAGSGTRTLDLRLPDGRPGSTHVNLSRISGVFVYSPETGTPTAARWSFGALDLIPAASPRPFIFWRGLNISHWLSQNTSYWTYASPDRLDEALVDYIATLRRGTGPTASLAFDHLRIPVEYDLWGTLGGTATAPTFTLNPSRVQPFVNALGWARARGLGVILDLHKLPGLELGGAQTLFTNPTQQLQAAAVWRTIAARFANEGPWLRFELMNEPVHLPIGSNAANSEVAARQEALRRIVRESNPNRVIYITANDSGNRYSFSGIQFSQPRYPAFGVRPTVPIADSATAFGADKNIAYTIHFYAPMGLTHYTPPAPILTAGALDFALGAGLTTELSTLRADLINQTAPNHPLLEYREIHVGEFGVNKAAEAHNVYYPRGGFTNVRTHFMRRVRDEAEAYGFGWCAWDHLDDGFSLFDRAPNGTIQPNPAGQAILSP